MICPITSGDHKQVRTVVFVYSFELLLT